MIRVPKLQQVTVRREGARVVLVAEGRAVLDLPWQAADRLAAALRAKAREAEEQDRAPQVARDAAILLRAGAPLGLTSDPRIQAEAGRLAAWDSELRRYMPGGIRSTAMPGLPAVRHATKKEV